MDNNKTALNSNVSSLNADIKCLVCCTVVQQHDNIYMTSLLQTNWLNRVCIMVHSTNYYIFVEWDHNN